MITVVSPELYTHENATASAAAPPETVIFRSRLPDIPISNHLPLHVYCFENLSDFADHTFLIYGPTGRTYTFAETHLLSRRTAAGLAALGIKQGDVILLLLQNCPEFAFAFLGASILGAAATAANPFCTTAEIRKQVSASGAKLVITHSIYVEKFDRGLTPVITVDNPPDSCLPFTVLSGASEAEIPEVSIEADDPVALPFSSGTTGLPKGVVLTHRSLITSVAQQVDGENPNLFLRRNDLVLCVLPLFHIFSLNSVFLCSLRSGAAVLIMPKFEIRAMLDLIERHKVTVAPVVPPLVLALAKNSMVESYDLSSIRIVLSGAAPLGKELESALRFRLPHALLGQLVTRRRRIGDGDLVTGASGVQRMLHCEDAKAGTSVPLRALSQAGTSAAGRPRQAWRDRAIWAVCPGGGQSPRRGRARLGRDRTTWARPRRPRTEPAMRQRQAWARPCWSAQAVRFGAVSCCKLVASSNCFRRDFK